MRHPVVTALLVVAAFATIVVVATRKDDPTLGALRPEASPLPPLTEPVAQWQREVLPQEVPVIEVEAIDEPEEAEPPKPLRLPTFEEIAVEEEAFKDLWRSTDEEGLQDELGRLQVEIATEYSPILRERLAAGEYERVEAVDGGLPFGGMRSENVEMYTNDESGNYRRTTLPEGLYPGAYVKQRRLNWIADLQKELRQE